MKMNIVEQKHTDCFFVEVSNVLIEAYTGISVGDVLSQNVNCNGNLVQRSLQIKDASLPLFNIRLSYYINFHGCLDFGFHRCPYCCFLMN